VCVCGEDICCPYSRWSSARSPPCPSKPALKPRAIAGWFGGAIRFYDQVMQALLRTVDFAVVKCVVLASPGFYRDALLAYMMAEAVRLELRPLLENRSKFVLAYAASGHKYALRGAARLTLMPPWVSVYAHPELIVRRRRAGRD
jgi:hypothetical protein